MKLKDQEIRWNIWRLRSKKERESRKRGFLPGNITRNVVFVKENVMDCLINQLIGREIDRLVENCFRCLNETSSNIKNQIDSLLVYSKLIWADYKYAERFYHPINKILCRLRESKNLIDDYRGGGMIGGLGEVAFSVDAIQKQTGELKKLSHSLNQLSLT